LMIIRVDLMMIIGITSLRLHNSIYMRKLE